MPSTASIYVQVLASGFKHATYMRVDPVRSVKRNFVGDPHDEEDPNIQNAGCTRAAVVYTAEAGQ